MSGQAGRYQRSAAGMIGAMLVLVAGIFAFVLLRDINREVPGSPVKAVDYSRTAAYAEEQASFDVLAPDELPEGWKATTVEFVVDPARWHLGVLTDQGNYVGLEQADSSVESMVSTYVDPAANRGKPVTIEGQAWISWSDSGGDTALVRRAGHVTTLVVTTADEDVLVDYIESLR